MWLPLLLLSSTMASITIEYQEDSVGDETNQIDQPYKSSSNCTILGLDYGHRNDAIGNSVQLFETIDSHGFVVSHNH